jgi:competence protein ComEA
VTPDGRIVLNVASADELTRLPGIGQKRAEQIVALRERLGKFKRITDLLRVKGIGPKSLRRLTPLLVLDPPTEEPGS